MIPVLTPHEVHALQLYATGATQTRAARPMGVSTRTYRRLLADATTKLGCRHPVQAVVLAAQARVITGIPQPKRQPSVHPIAGLLARPARWANETTAAGARGYVNGR